MQMLSNINGKVPFFYRNQKALSTFLPHRLSQIINILFKACFRSYSDFEFSRTSNVSSSPIGWTLKGMFHWSVHNSFECQNDFVI